MCLTPADFAAAALVPHPGGCLPPSANSLSASNRKYVHRCMLANKVQYIVLSGSDFGRHIPSRAVIRVKGSCNWAATISMVLQLVTVNYHYLQNRTLTKCKHIRLTQHIYTLCINVIEGFHFISQALCVDLQLQIWRNMIIPNYISVLCLCNIHGKFFKESSGNGDLQCPNVCLYLCNLFK